MAIAAAGGNDFVNLSYAPYFITPSATAAANTAALVQAYTDNRKSSTIGGKRLYIPGSSSAYPFNATSPTSPGRLVGDGPGSTRLLFPPGTPFKLAPFGWRTSWSGSGSTVLTVQINQGDTVITGITSTAGWSAGDWICIGASNSAGNVPGTNSGALMGEWVRIKTVDSSTQVTLWGPVEETYPLSWVPLAARGNFWHNCSIEGVTFDNSSPGTTPVTNDDVGGAQVNCQGLFGLQVNGVEVINGSGTGFAINTCLEFEVSVSARDLMDNPTVGELGYGALLWNGSQNGTLKVHAERCRHGVTTGGEAMGIPRHITITGTVTQNTGTSFDTHAEGKHLIFQDCHATNSSPIGYSSDESAGFQLRAPHILIRGGEVFGCRGWAVQGGGSSATDCVIDGLRINTMYGHALDSTGGGVNLNAARSILRNCEIRGTLGVAVQMAADGLTVKDNVFRRTSGSVAAPISATGAATAGVVKNNVARGGYTSMVSGTTTGITEDDSTVLT
jgi:hypothetical protein